MRGPMLRFVVVAILLLLLAVFYAARLGDEPEQPGDTPSDAGSATSGPVVPQVMQPPAGDKKEDWFPDLSDRNDIPGVTLGIMDDRSTFGCDVEALASRLGRSLSDDNNEGRFLAYIDMLSASGDAEFQLAALQLREADALGSGGDEDSGLPTPVDHLSLALQADPMNPLVLWNASGACRDPELHSFCTDPNVQTNMQTVLGSNGGYWVQEAERLFVAGDHDASLEALRRAASAPVFDSYFVDHLRMHQRALSLIPDLDPIERAMGAYALSMTRMDSSVRGLGPCFYRAEDPSWFEVCVAVANRVASESPTIMQRALGMEFLSRIYEVGGQAEAAELERTRVRELTGQFWVEDEDKIAVLVTDERVLSLYLEELEAGGEVNALQFLNEEIERLKQDPTYTPCPSDEADD